MDKKEILEKSRAENRKQDERERSVGIQSSLVGLLCASAVILFLACHRMFVLSWAPIDDLLVILCAALAGTHLHRAIRLKSLLSGLCALIFLAIGILHLIEYLLQGR